MMTLYDNKFYVAMARKDELVGPKICTCKCNKKCNMMLWLRNKFFACQENVFPRLAVVVRCVMSLEWITIGTPSIDMVAMQSTKS